MRSFGLQLSLFIFVFTTGCAGALTTESDCEPACSDDQACIEHICYDTCSNTKPCTNAKASCKDNICVTQDNLCVPNTLSCSADKTQVVSCTPVGLGYTVKEICQNGATCEGGTCIGSKCTPDTMRCNDNRVEKCDADGHYIVFSDCNAQQVCDESSFSCKNKPECTNQNKRCNNDNAIETCIDSQWVQTEQCGLLTCDNKTATCVDTSECQNDAKECQGDDLKICINKQWKIQSCGENSFCRENECVESCTEQEKRCYTANNTTYVQICYNHYFRNDAQCLSGTTCQQNGTNAECVANCGNHQLDENEICDDNLFADTTQTCRSLLGESYEGELQCNENCEIDTSQCFKPTINGWNYIQTFENIETLSKDKKLTTQYSSTTEMTEEGIQWVFSGITDITSLDKASGSTTTHRIDGIGLVMRKSANNTLDATEIPRGIHQLALDYRSWGGTSDNGTLIISAGSKTFPIPFTKDNTTPQTFTADIEDNVDAFHLSFDSASGNNGARIVIDNIRWTNLQ